MRYKHKPRPPMRGNSCSLSVRMMEEQYQRLCRYLAITRLPVTTYFRKLIKEATIHARMPRQKIDPHPAANHIYSNIRQIARCPRARTLAPEQIAQLEFLADKLCEETKMSEEQKSKVQQVKAERLQCSHGQLIRVVSVFPQQGSATPEDKLKALIDLDAQQGKLCV